MQNRTFESKRSRFESWLFPFLCYLEQVRGYLGLSFFVKTGMLIIPNMPWLVCLSGLRVVSRTERSQVDSQPGLRNLQCAATKNNNAYPSELLCRCPRPETRWVVSRVAAK